MLDPTASIPQDGWYVACATEDLEPGRPRALQIADRRLVAFRDTRTASCFDDRCRHRGVALSSGSVREGCLVCPRHGWAFDLTGDCRSIPTLLPHESVPSGYCLRRHRFEPAGGYYWIWIGNTPPTGPPKPLLPELGTPGHSVLKIGLTGDFFARDALENLLDVSHIPFVHVFPKLPLEQRRLLTRLLDLRRHAGGVTLFGGVAADEHNEAIGDLEIRIDYARPLGLRLEFPKAAPGDATAMAAYFAPLDAGRCRCEFIIAFPFPDGSTQSSVVRVDYGTGSDPFFTAGQLLDEDLRILRAQAQRRLARPSRDRLVPGDALIAESRRAAGPSDTGRAPDTVRRRVVAARCGCRTPSWPPTT